MAAAELQRHLAELHEVIDSGGTAHGPETAQDLVVDIAQLCLNQTHENELAFCRSELFQKETGIVTFLQKAVSKDEYAGSKVQALEFLLGFVQKAKELVLDHAKDIKDVCMSLYTRDKSAKVKSKTFPLVIELLKLTSTRMDDEAMGVDAMLKKFFGELGQPSKLSQSVKLGIYQTLGAFGEYYPQLMMHYSDRLFNVLVSTLKQQMTTKTKKPEMTTVAGCLMGLSHLLVNFTQSVEENSKHCKDIYQYVTMSVDPGPYRSGSKPRYDIPKAGLNLIGRHADQFNEYLYRDHEMVYMRLLYWSHSHNSEMKWAGYEALQAFFKVVSHMLVENADKKRSSDVAVLKYFIKSFRSTIDDASSSSKSLSTAIRGYGVFAAPCKAFMKEADVRFMFNEIIQRSEQQFLVQGEERLTQLPTYLEALASIVGQLDTVTDTFLTSLEKLVVLVFGSYPHQARSSQWTSHSAILQVLIALSAKGTSLQGFLSRVVYQWILRTCSFPVLLEAGGDEGEEQRSDEMEIEQDSRRVSYKSFMDIWTRLLDSKFIKTSEAHGSSYAERLNIHTMIYNELVGGILKVLKKLDLSSNKQNEEEASTSGGVTSDLEGSTSSDPLEGLQPTKPKDFQVFINLVDFTKELLPMRQIHLFNPWVYRFGHELIQLSSQLPLVSGFYKLLTICMTMSTKTAFFKEVNPNVAFKTEVKEEEPMNVDDESESIATRTTPSNVSLSDKQACFILFSKFSKEVLIRLKQYKDDLLASCLFLILSLPHQVVENQVHDVIPALKTAFKLGLSYLPLAESGLSALQAWIRYIPSNILKPYYAQVLPQLDGYLGAGSGSEDEGSRPEVLVVQTASSRVGRRRIPSKLLKKAKDNDQSQDSPLRSVQLQILRLLGSLGGSVNVGLLETSAQELSNVALAWDSQPRLNFPVPFVDMKPEIQLDAFLPRIVELAMTSSDRQTKVAACEALHTLVLFMLGKGSQQPDQREAKSPMNQLYKKVFPAVLQLACDVEQVARQLFEPLVMQLIHWFSGNKKYESDETSTLLNAILAGIVHPTDTALRDFCARCISEFLRWSIKQTSKKQQEKSPINTKSLLKRLYSMASHPSAFKRLGAALAFNSIYTIFREEEVLVDQFTFELLVVFVESLALAHHDDKSLGTQEQGSEVLKHLERIMRVKAALLNKESKNRRVPRGLPEDCSPTLSHMVMWLMTQCGRPQTECRHQCMVLVYQLTSLLPGRNTPATWMQNTARERGAEYFVGRFEGGGHKSGIQKQPTLASVEQQFSVKATITWLEYLLAALDCYVWVLGESLLTPAAVFKTVKEGKKSVLFQSIDSFMKVAQYDLFTYAKGCGSMETAFTPREEEEYNRTKCTVIIRLFYFMGAMLGTHTKEALEVIPSKLWTGLFAEILCGCVLKPASLGFNMADIVIMNALPQTTNRVLGLLYSKLPTEQLKKLETVIHKRITASRSEDLFSILSMLFSDESDLGLDHVQLQHLVNGYKQLQKAKLLTRQTTNQALSILDFVMRGLVRRGENGQEARKMTPSEIDLGQRLLELAFQLGVQTNSLIDCLLESTSVVSSTRSLTSRLSASKTSLGVLFLTTYKQPIMDQLVKHGQDTVYQLSDRVREDRGTIGMIIYGLLEHAVGNREIRKRYGMAIHSAVLTHWDTLSNLGQEDEFMLNLIKKVLQIDFKFAKDPTHLAFRLVFNQYLSMLRDSKKSLAWKTQVLDVLYFFANVPEKEEKELKSSLDLLVANHFPLKSTDLDQGSPRYNDYIMALNKILTSLVMSESLMLLELIISILCRDDKHSYEDKIQGALSSFAKRLPLEKQSAAANIPFEIFKQDKRYSKEIRKAAIQRVCIPLLRQASRDATVTFYKGHIHDIISVLEARLTKNPVPAFENQLVSKICYFELIEVLYSRLSKDDLNSKDSALNREYRHGNVEKGNEMSTALTKAAFGARNEDCRGETVAVELRRQFHCAAFNCSAAIISCVQDNIKFYNAFLFSENLAKGQFLLDNLVDPKKEYSFAIEMDAPVERKKRFVAIRTQARETNTPEESGYVSGPAHYLSSQYLTDSSLSEDVNQFDFSSSVRHFGSSMESQRNTAGGSQGSQGSQRTGSLASRQDSKPIYSPGGEYLEMEEDPLNQHECMAAMTGVLKHMTNNKINPDITKATRAEEMPVWMSGLQKKLSSSSTEHNLKLFIVRLVINAQDVFQPYARFWLSPLMQFLAGGQQGGINYMVLDIMLVMLDWSTVAVPEDKRLASGVLRFLMENSYHERKSVMKNNLEVIKTLVECWQGVIDVPTRVIYESLQDRSPDKKDSAVGIHLLGVILANKLHPLSPTCDVDEDRFYSVLASNIDNRYKAVHGAAAEVIGMAMKQMAEHDKITDGCLHEVTYKELSQLHLGSGKEVIFITCLHKIHLHYPVFTDRFMNKLLFMLPSIHGQPKTECLQIITARIEHIDNAFIEMKNKNILALLTHKDEADQLTSLKLVDGMLPKLKSSELRYLLPAVKDFVSHPSPSCRDAMYSILMWIYDNYRDEDKREGKDGDESLSIAKDTLLQGLSDQDNYLRLRVSNFWSHETRLPKETLERLISMLGCMYSPGTENRYLGYATNLLLEMTSKSPDFKREIFEHPLSACKFEEVQIDHSWRQRHAAISTPKFVETQVGQSQGSIRGSPSSQSMTSSGMSMGGGGQLRATQATQNFTATQDNAASSHKNGYNWLTGSQDTFADYSSSSSASESSLLFTMGSLPKRTAQGFRGVNQEARAGGSRDNEARKAPSEGEKEVQRLKRRFMKDQSSQSAFFAKRATRQKKLREEVQKSQRERRFAQVTMYRQYRTGDLPDIQIKHSDIIAPLQALALRDSTLSRLLFCALFRGILARIGDMCTDEETELHVKGIERHLNQMLTDSNQFDPAFISCMLEIGFYHSEQLTLDPAAISQSCLTSRQLLIGIRVLEEVLIKKSGDDERSRKRARTSRPEPSQEMSTWIELARLYKAMGEFDVLRGIFGALIKTKDVTQEAIQAESRGDYESALKLYSKAISSDWGQDVVAREEEDFWDEARLQCCNQLTKWDDMENFSTDQIEGKGSNDLSQIWNDDYQQEIYLPYMMRSKLKRLMEGSGDDSLLGFIDSSAKDQEKRVILESRYTEELAALSILKEDYNRAKYYLANCTSSFLQEWSGLGPLMLTSRLSKLQDIQKLTEAEQFLQLANKPFSEGLKSSATRLLSDWSRNLPDPKRDPISVWDDVIQYRCLYMDKLCNLLGDSGGGGDSMETEDQKFDDLVRREKVLLSMKMADSACQQANFCVAAKHLKSTHRGLAEFEDLRPAWTHSYVSMTQRKALLLKPYERITSLLKALDFLGKLPGSHNLGSDLFLLCDHHILTSKTYQSMASALQVGKGEMLTRLSDAGKLDKLLSAAECQENKPEKVCQSLFMKSKKYLDDAVGTIKLDPVSNSSSSSAKREEQSMAKAHMALSSFCDQLLRQKDDDDCNPDCMPVMGAYPSTVVNSTLQAMNLNSAEARQHFPRLLQLVELYPDTMQTLVKEASIIPSWMFIGWISQMVALLDKPESLAVQGILKAIAKDYPQALVYPFKISSEDFKLGEKSQEAKQRKDAVKELEDILSTVPLVENLTLALQRLTHPGFIFKDWGDEINSKMKSEKRDHSAIKKEYQQLYQQLFESGGRRGEPSSSCQTIEAGPYWKKFGRDWQKKFDSALGKDGSKLAEMEYKPWARLKQEIYLKMNPGKGDPGNLKEYSPWFTAFQTLQGDELEIPGQYDGSKKPLPAYHVKIAGFDEMVLTLSSLRKPKCITIRGNDEMDYPFLVKVGEDLRMDQRIEQLYCIMNGILAQDAACSQRGLTLTTYQVVPMTPRLGILEWVKRTTTLKEFITRPMTEAEQKVYTSRTIGPAALFNTWAKKFCKTDGNTTNVKIYAEVYKKANETDTITAFREREATLPWDLLRRGFMQLSASPEAFLTMRAHFARSHAVLCICQYILGIGDRHLSNFLVSLETGGMVGIDFGHSFGSATQFLPIPELIPFRLTRQIINLMLPMKIEGVLQSTMVHTLRALRQNHELLVNTMDVFVKEPSLDWKGFAVKQATSQDKGQEEPKKSLEDISWYPKEKIKFAKMKLQGANSTYITKEELEMGHSKDADLLEALKAICDGKMSKRARCKSTGLSVEDQVACLIDHATDPNVLGKTYQGWEPWV